MTVRNRFNFDEIFIANEGLIFNGNPTEIRTGISGSLVVVRVWLVCEILYVRKKSVFGLRLKAT